MNFKELATKFEASAAGTDAFKSLYLGAFAEMKADPKHAALYFIIGIAAQAYVRQYEDQAVSHELAQRAKLTLQGFNDKVLTALTASPEVALQLISEVASHYQLNTSDF